MNPVYIFSTVNLLMSSVLSTLLLPYIISNDSSFYLVNLQDLHFFDSIYKFMLRNKYYIIKEYLRNTGRILP